MLLDAADAAGDPLDVELRLALDGAAVRPLLRRHRLPPGDRLGQRIPPCQPDEDRGREDRLEHLPVGETTHAATKAQQVQEHLDLVPVELDPECPGAARVPGAADEVVVEAAPREARHDLLAERLAEVLRGAPNQPGVGEQVAEHRRARARRRADEERPLDPGSLDPAAQRPDVSG